MSAEHSTLSRFPKTLRHSTQRPDIMYMRVSDRYARRGRSAEAEPDELEQTLSADNGEQIRVYRGGPKQVSGLSTSPGVIPVYATPSSKSVVVPTGRIFIRFADSVPIDTRAAELKKAGYKIVQSLAYAANAGWLVAENEDCAEALNSIGKLEALADVENVEPQLLAPRVLKSK